MARFANWFGDHWRALSRFAMGIVAASFLAAAMTAGGNMRIVIPLLFVAFVLSAIDVFTVSGWKGAYRTYGIVGLALFFGATGFYIRWANKDDAPEDLRVSFDFHGVAPTTLEISYLFRNFGRQTTLVNGVALFDMQGTNRFEDPTKYVELCDTVPIATLLFQGMTHNFLRFSEAPGIMGTLIHPSKIEIEGLSGVPKNPVSIESGRTRTITATFEIPKTEKDFDTRIFCPVIDTRDENDVVGTGICRGASVSWQLAADLTRHSFNDFRRFQGRILPYSNKLPTCPTVQ